MTRTLAVEWAKYRIHVNAIAPGYFKTNQTAPLFADEKRVEWMLSRIPLGRAGIPDDLEHRTKWRMALDLIDRSRRNGVFPGWLTFDAGYGMVTDFMLELDHRGVMYVGEVAGHLTGWTKPPAVMLKEFSDAHALRAAAEVPSRQGASRQHAPAQSGLVAGLTLAGVHGAGVGTVPGKEKVMYEWVDGENITPKMMLAVVAAEDQKFPVHFGFDLEAIEKAMAHNRGSKKIRGASTITQQVPKYLFLWPSRSWIRKGMEVYFTGLIEVFWSKQRIVEVYVNIAQFDENIFGVRAASKHFFRKSPDKLTMHETASLAAVLPSPKRYHAEKPS